MTMNMRIKHIVSVIAVIATLVSCSNNSSNVPFTLNSIRISGEPYKLCEQKLTSEDHLSTLHFDYGEDSDRDYHYDKESTPVHDIFFWPEPDIKPTPEVKIVRSRYNYLAINNHVWHAYELFERKASDLVLKTRKDSIRVVKEDRLDVSPSLLLEAFPDSVERNRVSAFLNAYAEFDGTNDSPFWEAKNEFYNHLGELDSLTPKELLDDFAEHFWEWYDKRKYVPELDSIAVIYLTNNKDVVTDENIAHLKRSIEGEKDINRRTILALELMRLDRSSIPEATLYLGEILESGIYTKYIVEAWVAWRACVQSDYFAPSSFSLIPNRYYDRIRVKCLNTILRHMQKKKDKYDPCLLVNLMACEPLHRMYFIGGNESTVVIYKMAEETFIQPSALGRDYLKREE